VAVTISFLAGGLRDVFSAFEGRLSFTLIGSGFAWLWFIDLAVIDLFQALVIQLFELVLS
jgi:hypothetical protein